MDTTRQSRGNARKPREVHAAGTTRRRETAEKRGTNLAIIFNCLRPLVGRSLSKEKLGPHSGRIRPMRSCAFSAIELLVLITISFLLVALLVPALMKGGAKKKRIGCVNNLKSFGLAVRVFATDNGDKFPWEQSTNQPISTLNSSNFVFQHLLALSNNIVNPKIFACPADTRKPATNWSSFSTTNISYFFSPTATETLPQSFLAGDRNLMTNGVRLQTGIVTIMPGDSVSWDGGAQHQFQGNCLMGDGSVQQLSPRRLVDQFANTGSTNVVIGIP